MVENNELTEAQMNDELTRVFRDGSVFNASEESLNKYLKHLCSGHVPNEMVRHREMNRCQVINTVKTFRFIDSVEKSNKIFTVIIIILTVITVFLSYQSISQSKDSSDQIERLVSSQEQKNKVMIDKLTTQVEIQNSVIKELANQNLNIANEARKLSEEVNRLNASNNASERDGAKKRAAPRL